MPAHDDEADVNPIDAFNAAFNRMRLQIERDPLSVWNAVEMAQYERLLASRQDSGWSDYDRAFLQSLKIGVD